MKKIIAVIIAIVCIVTIFGIAGNSCLNGSVSSGRKTSGTNTSATDSSGETSDDISENLPALTGGYTVVFECENTTHTENDDERLEITDNYDIPVCLELTNGTTIQKYSGIDETVEHVHSMYIPALPESVSLKYTMNEQEDYLYNYGSNNPSGTVILTGDVSISAFYSWQNCILADSMVTMADGSKKALGEIVVGDEILSYDWETGELIANPVIYASSQDDSQDWTAVRYFVWTFSDGTIIKSAFAHRFYNAERKCFVHLEYWNIGDRIYKEDGTFAALVSKETVYESCTYARITGLYGTNYFANGALTGDSECPQNIDFEHTEE